MSARFSYLSHLECSECQRPYDAEQLQNVSQCCSRPLLAVYDVGARARARAHRERAGPEGRKWRDREVLRVGAGRFMLALGEGMTPLLTAPRLAPTGLEQGARVLIKDEGQNPTGSFKARGMAAAVSRAVELGASGLVTPTAGNAGAAMAAYTARAGVPGYVTAPKDAPDTCIKQARLYGADVELVEGLISDAGRVAARVAQQRGWFNVATLREPYRVEGKKTMGLELAEQLGWRLPTAIIYPTGGGTGIVGTWKAFAELRKMGWLTDARLPKMIIVQAEGCAPLVQAFYNGALEAKAWPAEEANTVAAGLCVPSAIGDRLILQAVYESGGTAMSVSDDAMMQMLHFAAQRTGMLIALEAAATIAAYHRLLAIHFL